MGIDNLQVTMVRLLALLVATAAANKIDWFKYKAKFNKSYSPVEDVKRYEIYRSTMEAANAHNELFKRGKTSFRMGETQYTDYSVEEMKARNGHGDQRAFHMNSVGEKEQTTLIQYMCPNTYETPNTPLATEYNWVEKGYVTTIKNQMMCGGCWAFAAMGTIEGQWKAAGNPIVSMSPQQFIDCASNNVTMDNYSCYGCNGGFANNAFLYAAGNGGLDPYTAYSFADFENSCMYNPTMAVAGMKVTDCTNTVSADETNLAYAVQATGPIAIAIDAGLESFHNYVDGVYYAPDCSSTELDHAVTLTGYGTMPEISSTITKTCATEDFYCATVNEGIEIKYPCFTCPDETQCRKLTTNIPGETCNPPSASAGQEFWMVKNSWGLDWGMEGYILMARNMDNNCGIATDASFATLG